jgi:hypothetical protein
MEQFSPLGLDIEGEEVSYQGQTTVGEEVGEPDTAVAVTAEHLHASPLAGTESDESLDFSIALDDINTLQCDGILRRTVTLETDEETVTIPLNGFNEGRFRHALVSNSHLTNSCARLDLDRYGLCPCGIGTCVGSLLVVAGVAMILSVVGALLGILVIGVGAGMIGLVSLVRKLSEWRDANVWTQRATRVQSPN